MSRAEPVIATAPSNCWTCEHKQADGYCLAASKVPGVAAWAMDVPGWLDKMPPREATGCPGYSHEVIGG